MVGQEERPGCTTTRTTWVKSDSTKDTENIIRIGQYGKDFCHLILQVCVPIRNIKWDYFYVNFNCKSLYFSR